MSKQKEKAPKEAIKYPYDREELGKVLSNLFDSAIRTRDEAQAVSSRILEIKQALDVGYLNHLTEKNKGAI